MEPLFKPGGQWARSSGTTTSVLGSPISTNRVSKSGRRRPAAAQKGLRNRPKATFINICCLSMALRCERSDGLPGLAQ